MKVVTSNRLAQTIEGQQLPLEVQFTGPLILASNPVDPTDISTKEYVDNRFLSLSVDDLKTGILPAGRLPAFTGDVTNVAGSNIFSLKNNITEGGTYKKVTVDSKGRVIHGTTITSEDIPPLSWGKVVKNKPNTLAGYGITDGVKVTGDTITGTLKSTAVATLDMHAVTKGYIDQKSQTSAGSVDVGIILEYPSVVTPAGYLRCNGGEVSKTTYAALYAVIGDSMSTKPVVSIKPWVDQYAFNTQQTGNTGTWSTVSSLPSDRVLAQTVVTKNRVYLLCGHNGTAYTNTSLTAPINPDGTLGAWTSGGNLPIALGNSLGIVINNKVYIMGGYTGSSAVANVYSASINSDGTLAAWETETSLPIPLSHSQVAIVKNRVYLIGGVSTSGRVSDIYYATVSNEGALGPWVSAGNLPLTLSHTHIVVTNSRVYLLGGYTGSSYSSAVYSAPINADGSLGAWLTEPNLIENLGYSSLIVVKNKVFLIGGMTGNTSTSQVRVSTINADGTLGAWQTGTQIPQALYTGQAVVTSSRVYLLGGYITNLSGTTVSRNIYYTSFSGGSNDYTSYASNSPLFVLPDYTSKETDSKRFYIKY